MGLWSIWRRTKPKPRTGRRYPTPLTAHQLWMVSLSAPVSRDHDASRTTLYPFTRIDDDSARSWLAAGGFRAFIHPHSSLIPPDGIVHRHTFVRTFTHTTPART